MSIFEWLRSSRRIDPTLRTKQFEQKPKPIRLGRFGSLFRRRRDHHNTADSRHDGSERAQRAQVVTARNRADNDWYNQQIQEEV